MPGDESEYHSLVADLLGRSGGDGNRLGIHHLAHHTSGAIGGAHQNWIDTQLLRSNSLQASEQSVGRRVAPREGDSEPAEERPKKRIEPAGTRESEAKHRIETRVTSHIPQS